MLKISTCVIFQKHPYLHLIYLEIVRFQPEQFFGHEKLLHWTPKRCMAHQEFIDQPETITKWWCFCPLIWKMCSSNYGSFPWFFAGIGVKIPQKIFETTTKIMVETLQEARSGRDNIGRWDAMGFHWWSLWRLGLMCLRSFELGQILWNGIRNNR